MVRIRRFSVIRTATVVAVMYALLIAIVFVPIILLLAVAGTTTTAPGLGGVDTGPFGGAGLVGALLLAGFAIVFYTILGWIFTAIACLIYNLAARFVGGIEVEVDRFEPPARAVPVAWTQTGGGLPPGSAPPPSVQPPPLGPS